MRATDLTVRPAGKALGGCSTYRTGILFKQSRPDLSDSRIATEGLAASPLKRWPNMIAGRDMTSSFKPYHRGSKLIDEEPLPSKEHQLGCRLPGPAQRCAPERQGAVGKLSRPQNVEKPRSSTSQPLAFKPRRMNRK